MKTRHPFDLALSELQELNLDFDTPSIFVELCLLCNLSYSISRTNHSMSRFIHDSKS